MHNCASESGSCAGGELEEASRASCRRVLVQHQAHILPSELREITSAGASDGLDNQRAGVGSVTLRSPPCLHLVVDASGTPSGTPSSAQLLTHVVDMEPSCFVRWNVRHGGLCAVDLCVNQLSKYTCQIWASLHATILWFNVPRVCTHCSLY